MLRVDSYPTHECEGVKLRPGRVLPFGATIVEGGVNFSISSSNATSSSVCRARPGKIATIAPRVSCLPERI